MRLWLLLALSGLCACATLQDPASGRTPPVVVVSIDGFRPDFYRSQAFEKDCPNLRRLAASGSRARGMRPVFPSITYPNHVSLVTGRSSAIHGIEANTVLSAESGPTSEWYWYDKAIRVPTLWSLVKKAGGHVAIVRWPASVGSGVDWILPEIFYSPGFDITRDWGRIRENSDPAFIRELAAQPGFREPKSVADLDRISAQAAELVLREKRPDLTLVHLINGDYVQHLNGPDAPETHAAVRELDSQIGRITQAADLSRARVLIVGDHGFRAYEHVLHLNVLFLKEGWIQAAGTPNSPITSWDVVAQADGGHAAIHVKRPELEDKVRALLSKESHGRFRILEKAELRKLRAYSGATFVALAEPGYTFGAQKDGPFEVNPPKIKGHHGYLPDDPAMATGFIAVGEGIRAGVDLGEVRVIDVAPTVADLLAIPGGIPDAEGRPLPIKGPLPGASASRAGQPAVPEPLLDNLD